jgi:hypothetical protein
MTVKKISNPKSQFSNLKFQICDRRGFTLLEVSLAGLLLVVLMAITVQMLAWVASERRAADRRQWAIQEAANVMEHLAARPWENLTADHVASIELSAPARDVLPEAELQVTVVVEPDQPNAKRLGVTVRWHPRPEQPAAQARLTSWVYRREESQQ